MLHCTRYRRPVDNITTNSSE